jgi:outer membrane protein, multidrug efflux system
MKAFTFVTLLAGVATSSLHAVPSVGPDYQKPETAAPASYRDLTSAISATEPNTLQSDWWLVFNDPALNQLETTALAANQDLRAALARVEQARAIAGVARSSYLPSLAVNPSATRENNTRTIDNDLPVQRTTTYRLPLDLSWELDLFGRVRRLNETTRAELAASGATYDAARLSLTAEVASTYFTLRALDHERRVVTATISLRRDALQLVQARYNSGNAGDLDVARAETELATTEADAAALTLRRSSTQNALAVLLGEPAPQFTAPTATVANSDDRISSLPAIPAGLPSELLTRRPDIAAAERTLAAANARIGLAKAAFFPALSLTGNFGYASADIDDLFKNDSKFWSIGPSLYLPLFQGGRNRANLARSRAVYEETLAAYRQRVLVAFREVQDGLTASQLLAQQADAQARAVASARRGSDLSQKRYDAGFVSYLEVVDAQRTALEVERANAQLIGQRWITHVALIKALGGGWKSPTSPAQLATR